MKVIPLTKGQFAKVDDEDYDHLMQWKWYAKQWRTDRTYYAKRTQRDPITKKSVTISMHRFIMNCPADLKTDHENHDGLDNQKHNLRNCTNSENGKNKRSAKNSSSQYLGVSLLKNNKEKGYPKIWKSSINLGKNKIKHLGVYKDEIEAAQKYDEAAKEYHKEFANLNFK